MRIVPKLFKTQLECSFLNGSGFKKKARGNQAGVLMMLYDHEVRGLENALTNLQHHYADTICSTLHIHLSEKECLEAIAVKGNSYQIRRLSDELAAKRGVKLLKTMVISI